MNMVLLGLIRQSIEKKNIGVYKEWLDKRENEITPEVREVLYVLSSLYEDDATIDFMDMLLDLAIQKDCEIKHKQAVKYFTEQN